ncbi:MULTISPECIES: hypothetical protein [Paracoccus]|uniref:Uncharacterized protein n=1 Tax=Paracoccus onubensis TaxID=1675788 RepID=A0A418ST38_9RHOB|nr:hypothetical protein [Paracoccus onubensis]MDP0928998.1 hypothetical protein [Paracoccus onubensis]RJE84038.1 hypothetical protein D3P04_13565 [Paracoccus onubensis]
MPRIDATISFGNIISLVGTILTAIGMASALFVWGGRLSERASNFDTELLRLQSTAQSHETRIRTVEQMSARQDERLVLILDALRKIEARLDRGQ